MTVHSQTCFLSSSNIIRGEVRIPGVSTVNTVSTTSTTPRHRHNQPQLRCELRSGVLPSFYLLVQLQHSYRLESDIVCFLLLARVEKGAFFPLCVSASEFLMKLDWFSAFGGLVVFGERFTFVWKEFRMQHFNIISALLNVILFSEINVT